MDLIKVKVKSIKYVLFVLKQKADIFWIMESQKNALKAFLTA